MTNPCKEVEIVRAVKIDMDSINITVVDFETNMGKLNLKFINWDEKVLRSMFSNLFKRAPSADLENGETDEGDFKTFTYNDMDIFITPQNGWK